jgi:hypothetical protein
MASEKLSVSVDAELWAAARSLPLPERSASAVVAEALRRMIAGEQLRALLDELDAEFGPVPDDEIRAAERRWSLG